MTRATGTVPRAKRRTSKDEQSHGIAWVPSERRRFAARKRYDVARRPAEFPHPLGTHVCALRHSLFSALSLSVPRTRTITRTRHSATRFPFLFYTPHLSPVAQFIAIPTVHRRAWLALLQPARLRGSGTDRATRVCTRVCLLRDFNRTLSTRARARLRRAVLHGHVGPRAPAISTLSAHEWTSTFSSGPTCRAAAARAAASLGNSRGDVVTRLISRTVHQRSLTQNNVQDLTALYLTRAF